MYHGVFNSLRTSEDLRFQGEHVHTYTPISKCVRVLNCFDQTAGFKHLLFMHRIPIHTQHWEASCPYPRLGLGFSLWAFPLQAEEHSTPCHQFPLIKFPFTDDLPPPDYPSKEMQLRANRFITAVTTGDSNMPPFLSKGSAYCFTRNQG